MSEKPEPSPASGSSPLGRGGGEGAAQPHGQFLVYPTEDGRVKINVRLENETVWLTQQQMADLFQTTKQNISLHFQNIFEDRELERTATVKESLTVQTEGNRAVQRRVEFYNLDAIISVGYRVKSAVATRFRIWATQQLREFIVKGFLLDDERLKNPDQPFNYFDELLRRIQDIRTSERRFYQKITDIYATSIDYDPTQPESIEFFQTVQNKMHWAITGRTAAEIIRDRADSTKPNMGLTNWRGAKVRKEDVAIAKNYLSEPELAALNNLVEQYLVFAEGQAMRRVPMHMRDWITKLHGFLTINDRDILTHADKISHQMAKDLAESEYEIFHRQRIALADAAEGDFEKAVKQLPPPPKPKKKGGKK
ncbi:MAG: virulence RhuM family protein [Terrimicrobiaceae bacterium]